MLQGVLLSVLGCSPTQEQHGPLTSLALRVPQPYFQMVTFSSSLGNIVQLQQTWCLHLEAPRPCTPEVDGPFGVRPWPWQLAS